jgi:hypothetical protein
LFVPTDYRRRPPSKPVIVALVLAARFAAVSFMGATWDAGYRTGKAVAGAVDRRAWSARRSLSLSVSRSFRFHRLADLRLITSIRRGGQAPVFHRFVAYEILPGYFAWPAGCGDAGSV